MAQFKLAQNTKWHSLIELLEVLDLVDLDFMLKVFGSFWKLRRFPLSALLWI